MITRPLILVALLSPLTHSLVAHPVSIPELNTKGDVYKTEGPNDTLIYDSTVGEKKMIMLYTDFPDTRQTTDTKEVGETVLGKGKFLEIFHKQSHGKLKISIDHVHGWRQLPKNQKE